MTQGFVQSLHDIDAINMGFTRSKVIVGLSSYASPEEGGSVFQFGNSHGAKLRYWYEATSKTVIETAHNKENTCKNGTQTTILLIGVHS